MYNSDEVHGATKNLTICGSRKLNRVLFLIDKNKFVSRSAVGRTECLIKRDVAVISELRVPLLFYNIAVQREKSLIF